MQTDIRRFRKRGPRDSYMPAHFGRTGPCDLEALQIQCDHNDRDFDDIAPLLASLGLTQVSLIQRLRVQLQFRISKGGVPV